VLKKEFRDTLRILLESSLLLFAIPMILAVAYIFQLEAPAKDLIYVVSIMTVYVFAAYSGIAIFKSERKDKSLEYLLTLPLTKFKIYMYKWIPRLVTLLVLSLALIIVFKMTIKGILIPLFFLQLAGIFISLAFDSYLLSFCAMIILGFFYSISMRFAHYGVFLLSGENYRIYRYVDPGVVAALIIGIPLGISFAKAFNNMDLKPYKYSLKPYLQFTLPVLLLHIMVFFLFYPQWQRYYY
jgi:hypothetical protein